MSRQTILILGPHRTKTIDAIDSFLSAHLSLETFFISAKDIVSSLDVRDTILSSDDISVNWTLFDHTFSTDDIKGVLNLLPYLDLQLFSDFEQEDQRYAHAELSAYLLFALSRFRNVINPPWGGSIAGFCNSLPYQWLFVDSCNTQVLTPKFFFGMAEDAPIDLLGVNTVHSLDIFDGRNWRTGPLHNLPRHEPVFLYQRPRGLPVVITFLDDSWWPYSLAHSDIPSSCLAPLDHLLYLMKDHYHLRLGEVLCFVDTGRSQVTFGSVQPGIELSLIHI